MSTRVGLASGRAVFQHIHRVPHRSPDEVLCTKTRSKALLGVSLDASTMLGSVGRCGWIQRVGGKASSFRGTAEAESCSGQLVFVLRKMFICVVRAVTLCLEPGACALLLAASTLYTPNGAMARPPADDNTRRLHQFWRL